MFYAVQNKILPRIHISTIQKSKKETIYDNKKYFKTGKEITDCEVIKFWMHKAPWKCMIKKICSGYDKGVGMLLIIPLGTTVESPINSVKYLFVCLRQSVSEKELYNIAMWILTGHHSSFNPMWFLLSKFTIK